MRNLVFSIFVIVIPLCITQEPEWQPFGASPGEPSFPSVVAQSYQPTGGQCELHKVGFTQDLYFQYIQYKVDIPEMKEFTLCYWAKFMNHTNHHPIFSYAVDGQPRAILAWISNTDRSSYFSLVVEGHTFYRLNYPLRLNRWYHTCQSWNGRTGEWQIWVNAERVGRGFHNRLVGHNIPSGGVAITGQEQRQLGGGFLEGKEAPKGEGGMLGEITMLQLYNVALTAGKAHRDHKHHHAHRFDHNGMPITTPPPTTLSPRPTQPTHPLLTAGQINPMLRINFANGQQQPIQPQLVNGQNFRVQYVNGQFVGNLVSRQLTAARNHPLQYLQSVAASQPQQVQVLPDQPINIDRSYSQQTLKLGGAEIINSGLVHPTETNSGRVQFIDNDQPEPHQLFKRNSVKRGDLANTNQKVKRETDAAKQKRELILAGGHILDDSLLTGVSVDQSILDGLAGIGKNEPILQKQKESEEREPAEAEVRAVMNICSGCAEEPFEKALVFGWRTVPKKLYSGAFYTPAVPECRVF